MKKFFEWASASRMKLAHAVVEFFGVADHVGTRRCFRRTDLNMFISEPHKGLNLHIACGERALGTSGARLSAPPSKKNACLRSRCRGASASSPTACSGTTRTKA